MHYIVKLPCYICTNSYNLYRGYIYWFVFQVIEAKEAEQKLLESQLNDTKQEKDKKQEEVLRAREDVLSNFAELMETELQCSICNELFVKVCDGVNLRENMS